MAIAKIKVSPKINQIKRGFFIERGIILSRFSCPLEVLVLLNIFKNIFLIIIGCSKDELHY
jgi:hypothetical protein